MNYNHPIKNDSAIIVKLMCAVVFCVFAFLWLYFFQSSNLSVLQHLLSSGRTHYNPEIGTIIIIIILCLVQWCVNKITRLRIYFHALNWFPSMLLMAVLTSSVFKSSGHLCFSTQLWIFPLFFLLWICSVIAARKLQSYKSHVSTGFFSRCMWSNMLMMCLMMFFVAITANTNAANHYRTHAEMALKEQDFDEALRVGNQSLENDSSLMMLRMYALSRKGLLADRLFYYPLIPSAKAMLPTEGSVQLLIYPTDSLYRHLGAIPRRQMPPMDFLTALIRHRQAKPAAIDYLLCGYLIEKDLDAFASHIGQFYTVNDSLPRHYREALVLYTHSRSNPVIIYHDPVLDEDYADLQKLEEQYPLPSERKGQVMEHYANSYWYYYEYVGVR